jgi:hypothetical protein
MSGQHPGYWYEGASTVTQQVVCSCMHDAQGQARPKESSRCEACANGKSAYAVHTRWRLVKKRQRLPARKRRPTSCPPRWVSWPSCWRASAAAPAITTRPQRWTSGIQPSAGGTLWIRPDTEVRACDLARRPLISRARLAIDLPSLSLFSQPARVVVRLRLRSRSASPGGRSPGALASARAQGVAALRLVPACISIRQRSTTVP